MQSCRTIVCKEGGFLEVFHKLHYYIQRSDEETAMKTRIPIEVLSKQLTDSSIVHVYHNRFRFRKRPQRMDATLPA